MSVVMSSARTVALAVLSLLALVGGALAPLAPASAEPPPTASATLLVGAPLVPGEALRVMERGTASYVAPYGLVDDVAATAQAPEGGVYFVTGSGVVYRAVDDSAPVEIYRLPIRSASGLAVSDGDIYVAAGNRIYTAHRDGSGGRELGRSPEHVSGLVVDAGGLLLATERGVRRMSTDDGTTTLLVELYLTVDLARDSDGSLLVLTYNSGVYRLPASPSTSDAVELVVPVSGAWSLDADADGNLYLTYEAPQPMTRVPAASWREGTPVLQDLGAPIPGYSSVLALRQATAEPEAQEITFTSTAPADARVGGPAYTVTATGGASGNDVTFSSLTPTVCTVSGATVGFIGGGQCTVAADQAGSTGYAAAPQVTQGIAVTAERQIQTISFLDPPTTGFVDGTWTPRVTGGRSGNPVVLSVASGPCSLADGVVTYQGSGTCVVAADQGGNAQYFAAPREQHGVEVTRRSQTITFGNTPPADPVAGGSYEPRATSDSARAVTLQASPSTVCAVEQGVVRFRSAGSCTVTAVQAGDRQYLPADDATQTFTIAAREHTISFATEPPTAPVVGDTWTPGASSSEGQTVVLAVDDREQCSVSRGVVTFTRAGTCTVRATAGEGREFGPAAESRTIEVSASPLGEQAVTFDDADLPTTAYVGEDWTPVVTSSGDGEVTLSSESDACTVTEGVVDFVAEGTCTVLAEAAATEGFGPASATHDVEVSKQAQTIVFAEDSPSSGRVGGTWTPEVGGGASDLPVTLSVEGPCSLDEAGETVTYDDAGTCEVHADQAGDDAYAAAERATWEVEVSAADATTTGLRVWPAAVVARVAAVDPELGVPTGDVVVTVDGDEVGTVDVDNEGRARLEHLVPSGGRREVEATYVPDGLDWAPSDASYTRRDPVMTARVTGGQRNGAGWYRDTITVSFTCTATSASLSGTCPEPVVIDRAADRDVTRTVRTTDGGATTVTVDGLKVDRDAPTITVGKVGRPAYAVDARPMRCGAADALSGLAGDCVVTYGRLVLGPLGDWRRPWTMTATDRAGNTTTRSNSFVVDR